MKSRPQRKLAESLTRWRSMGIQAAERGDYRRALVCFRRARSVAGKLGDLDSRLRVEANIGTAYRFAGDYEAAKEIFENILEVDPSPRLSIICAFEIAVCQRQLGSLRQSLIFAEHARRLAELQEDIRSEALIWNLLGNIGMELRNHREALGQYRSAFAIAEALEDKGLEAMVLRNLGICYARLGEFENALQHLDRALEAAEAIGSLRDRAETHQDLGEAYVQLGKAREAITHLEESLRIAVDNGYESVAEYDLGLLQALGARPGGTTLTQ